MLSHIIIDEPSVWSRYADFLSQHTESVVVVCSTKTLEGLSSLGAPAYQYDLQRAVADGFIAPVTVRRFGAAVAPDPEELERMTRDFVLNRLADLFHGHPLADLVADLLRVIGYKTRVSPPGPDGGVDIVAHKDHLGIESPIIKVQVKSSAKTVGHADVASLYGNTCPGEFALFVTLGAFSSQSRYYARGKSNLRLISGPEFVDLLMEHYEALDAQFRAYIPMKRVFIPLVLDEQGEAPNSSETTRKLETKRRRNGGAPRNSVKGGREPE